MDKRHHPLDDLFRQGLNDLEIAPSEAGRSGFMEKAGRELNKRGRRTGWLPVTGVILGIGLLAGISLVIFHSGEKQGIKNPVATKLSSQTDTRAASGPEQTNPVPEIAIPSNTGINLKQPISQQHVQRTLITSDHYRNTDKNSPGVGEDNFLPENPSENLITDTSSMLITDSVTSLKQENNTGPISESDTKEPLTATSFDSLAKEPMGIRDSLARTPDNSQKKGSDHHSTPSFRNREWSICTGIYYTPEWIFNTLDKNKYVNNFGIEGQFRYGPYSVRTGVGLSITRGYNEIVIETKPYLGSYQSLDHITYQWDSRHYHLVPTYYTTLKEVFDTALHKNYFTLEKEYTYLQIPLVLGYDFFTEKWFSLGARVGPTLSVLLKTRELTSQYEAGKDEVISINNVTPDRIHLNWQAMAGINASFRLSGFIIFELEPEIRYYFNSVYEKASPSDKPWSVGIRGAVLFNL